MKKLIKYEVGLFLGVLIVKVTLFFTLTNLTKIKVNPNLLSESILMVLVAIFYFPYARESKYNLFSDFILLTYFTVYLSWETILLRVTSQSPMMIAFYIAAGLIILFLTIMKSASLLKDFDSKSKFSLIIFLAVTYQTGIIAL